MKNHLRKWRPGRRSLMVIGAVVVVLAGGSVAAAAALDGPQGSDGVIHGCYTTKAVNGSHVFVMQDAGTSCPSGSTAISWNAQGPAGPAGPAGPTGPAGPQGPPGTGGSISGIDALAGTPCNTGTQAGTLQVSYSASGTEGFDNVNLTCAENNPMFTLTVQRPFQGTNPFNVSITASPGGKVCSFPHFTAPAPQPESCTAGQFAKGTAVTLTATVTSADPNITPPPAPTDWQGCQPSADKTSCTLTVNGTVTVTVIL